MKALIYEVVEFSEAYRPIGIVYMSNGCCKDRPVVITEGTPGIYSTQCACGGWCSNGHKTVTAAVLEYQHMSDQKRGIWDASQMGPRINELERVVLAAEHWDD